MSVQRPAGGHLEGCPPAGGSRPGKNGHDGASKTRQPADGPPANRIIVPEVLGDRISFSKMKTVSVSPHFSPSIYSNLAADAGPALLHSFPQHSGRWVPGSHQSRSGSKLQRSILNRSSTSRHSGSSVINGPRLVSQCRWASEISLSLKKSFRSRNETPGCAFFRSRSAPICSRSIPSPNSSRIRHRS